MNKETTKRTGWSQPNTTNLALFCSYCRQETTGWKGVEVSIIIKTHPHKRRFTSVVVMEQRAIDIVDQDTRVWTNKSMTS